MAAENFVRLSLTVILDVPIEALEQHVAASPEVVGDELASQIHAYAVREGLGYYPAVDYFAEQGGIEADLVDAVEHIAWLASSLVREEVRMRLRGGFSSIDFQAIQSLAHTMPTIRPRQANALLALAHHFTPNRLKVDLLLSAAQQQSDQQTFEHHARESVCRRLSESFDHVEVTHVQVL